MASKTAAIAVDFLQQCDKLDKLAAGCANRRGIWFTRAFLRILCLFRNGNSPRGKTVTMDSSTLRAVQAPVKQLYQNHPDAGLAELSAEGHVDFERIGCHVPLLTNNGHSILAGLHPAAGGNGMAACSGEMLLQALVSCAGTTLAAVAVSMGLQMQAATVKAVGRMDFRGTMGVSRETPVGMTDIQLLFSLQTDAPKDTVSKLVQLTERYCVVLRTLTGDCTVRSEIIS
jgi:uncharacterized OsmC-like protein